MNVSSGGFEFSVQSVGGLWRWRVVASNVAGARQLYVVEDVFTPFGPLSVVSSPIPGEVVTAMADSLATMRQQLRSSVHLVGPVSLSLTVTERNPVVVAGAVKFSNAGALGSFMTVTVTSDSPWLSSRPSTVTGMDKNQEGSVQVLVDPRLMLAASSPYAGRIIITDDVGNSVTVPVAVVVLPRPVIAVSAATLNLSYWVASRANGGPLTSTVSNSGPVGSVLDFTVSKVMNVSPWLSIAPLSGSNLASGSGVPVVFSVVNANVPAVPGIYVEMVNVVSKSAPNSPVTLTVSLTVT